MISDGIISPTNLSPAEIYWKEKACLISLNSFTSQCGHMMCWCYLLQLGVSMLTWSFISPASPHKPMRGSEFSFRKQSLSNVYFFHAIIKLKHHHQYIITWGPFIILLGLKLSTWFHKTRSWGRDVHRSREFLLQVHPTQLISRAPVIKCAYPPGEFRFLIK